MTPGARIAAAIELLSSLDALDAPPADRLMADWARQNRYAGSKDRAAVADMVFGVLRRRGQIDWWLTRAGSDIPGPRPRLLVWLQLAQRRTLADLDRAFTGEHYDPQPLSPTERRVAVELGGQDGFEHSCQSVSISDNVPNFLEEALVGLYGEDAPRQVTAYRNEAPVDLRVNLLRTDRKSALAALVSEGVVSEATPLSPIGLRLTERRPLSGTKVFKSGLIEPQDEASQLAALLVEARPGHKVADFCAGAGGKTLALAAAMRNTGRIVACDISEGRLKRADERFRRAGAYLIERRILSSERDKWIKRRVGKFDGGFDRVLVDAPCSGSGAWRRQPDRKWVLTETALDTYARTQAAILESAARLVVPGGRLIYVTCSILSEENEDRVAAFLAARTDFFVHQTAEIWGAVLSDVPYPGDTDKPYLRLTPADHGTDGFFVAVLGRKLVQRGET